MSWTGLISSIVSIATGIGVVAVVLVKFKGLLKEVIELLAAVLNALDEKSEGGTRITASEIQDIIKEAKDIPTAIKSIKWTEEIRENKE